MDHVDNHKSGSLCILYELMRALGVASNMTSISTNAERMAFPGEILEAERPMCLSFHSSLASMPLRPSDPANM